MSSVQMGLSLFLASAIRLDFRGFDANHKH